MHTLSRRPPSPTHVLQLSPEIIFTGHADRILPDAAGKPAATSSLKDVNVWGYTGVR